MDVGPNESAWKLKFKWSNDASDAAQPEPVGAAADAVPDDELVDADVMAEQLDTLSSLPKTKRGEYTESQAYAPVVEFLKALDLVAYTVADGEMLPDKLLFDEEVWTLRPNDPFIKGQHVKYLRRLRGRTDVVVLTEDFPAMHRNDTILRSHVKILIEIKTPSTMGPTGSLHEAMLQLIGANVSNSLRSPPVVVSNLTGTHYVLFMTREKSEAQPHYYIINQMYCASFGAAIHFALSVAKRDSCTEHFCRGTSREPTPDNSPPASPE